MPARRELSARADGRRPKASREGTRGGIGRDGAGTAGIGAAGCESVDAALFPQGRVAASAGLFLDSLPGNARRKSGWMRAEAAGDPARGGGRRSWAAAAGRPMRCAISCAMAPVPAKAGVVEHPAEADGVAVIEGTGFLKQGVLRGGAAIHRFSRQDHQLPARRVHRLCLLYAAPAARRRASPARCRRACRAARVSARGNSCSDRSAAARASDPEIGPSV